MPEFFKDKKFKQPTLDTIDFVNSVITEYRGDGYILTLRQLYYQLVARAFFKNSQRNYQNLSRIVSDARLAGLVPWSAIEDRTRNLTSWSHFNNPKHALEECLDRYSLDMWKNQPYYVEVWIEKEALVGVIQRICYKYNVPYFACRGYVSQSEQYKAGKRLNQKEQEGYIPLILHLGDHDPSGMDMTRDNEDRLTLFAEQYCEVKRLALNMDQIEELKPPPNPAKLTDSRSTSYIQEYGYSSWELDALSPDYINDLIKSELDLIINPIKWALRVKEQKQGEETLKKFINSM